MKQLKGDESTSKVYSNSSKEKNRTFYFLEKKKILFTLLQASEPGIFCW
jgi:hypothetical protein